MPWRVFLHTGFDREAARLGSIERERLEGALRTLAAALPVIEHRLPDAREPAHVPLPDLRPLRAAKVPHSYRLRVGPYRVALALLPAERRVIATALARRSGGTYRTLLRRHERRALDA